MNRQEMIDHCKDITSFNFVSKTGVNEMLAFQFAQEIGLIPYLNSVNKYALKSLILFNMINENSIYPDKNIKLK